MPKRKRIKWNPKEEFVWYNAKLNRMFIQDKETFKSLIFTHSHLFWKDHIIFLGGLYHKTKYVRDNTRA